MMVGGGFLWDFYRGNSYRSVAPSLIAQLIPPYKTTSLLFIIIIFQQPLIDKTLPHLVL